MIQSALAFWIKQATPFEELIYQNENETMEFSNQDENQLFPDRLAGETKHIV